MAPAYFLKGTVREGVARASEDGWDAFRSPVSVISAEHF